MFRLIHHPFLKIVTARTTLRNYHDKVIDHYEWPRNVGSFAKTDANVGTGLVGAPACGDVMKLQIKVDDTGKIVDARFKTFGCGSAIASSSFVTELIKVLAEDAIKAAISDLKAKRAACSS